MESYRDFARVYDEFMDQTPYDEWLLNILNIFKEYKIDKDAQVLDLGCGTGKMARKLAREGYQITAVDNSMISVHDEAKWTLSFISPEITVAKYAISFTVTLGYS